MHILLPYAIYKFALCLHNDLHSVHRRSKEMLQATVSQSMIGGGGREKAESKFLRPQPRARVESRWYWSSSNGTLSHLIDVTSSGPPLPAHSPGPSEHQL